MEKVVVKSDKEELTPKEIESNKKQLPEPSGYRILVAMPVADEKTEGGILKANSTIRDEEVSNICGMVIKLGPDCYKDERRFPSGPWCKEKDWVVFRAYSGTRMKMYGQEFRLINDDTVEAVVEDPTGVVRA
jgi:co-chaperonin GroES (HSP10)|tara:strand:+ start:205 stop:600 length:396 start_codon:yes stop_codon:yes gene_type:complete